MPQTLLDRAYHWEATTPVRLYMTQPIGGGRVDAYSWQRTLDEARRMASYLRSLELPAGSRIAILSKNCAHFILSDLAIWMAGHVSVALYPTLNAETVRYILEHSESKLLFLGKLDDWDTMKPGVPDDLPVVAYPLAPPNDYAQWTEIVARHAPLQGKPRPDENALAVLVYTSGSTGKPKGVMHSFASMRHASDSAGATVALHREDRMLSYLPLAHVMERAIVEACSLNFGFQIFFAERLETFLQDLQRARPTLFVSVPRLWLKFQLGVFQKMPQRKLNRLLKVPILSGLVKKKILAGLGLDSARIAASGSAPIPGELIQWYRDLGLELLECYGMTEDFACSHISLPGQTRVGFVGHPLRGVEVKLSPEGEVLIKSPGNMLGYYKEPELTAQSYTEDGFFRTGDRGERDAQGRLKITGRVKELFKTGKGKYVAPAPIENQLNAHPFIEMSCVAGSGQPQPHALVMLSEAMRAKASDPAVRAEVTRALETLRQEVNRSVDPHEALELIVVVKDEWLIENGFLTPTMKLKRNVIEDVYGPLANDWYAARQPVQWQA
jgi:long-chain acyl-CoA synthetase